jgi:hypothetical protein
MSLEPDARAAISTAEAAMDAAWSTEDPIGSFCEAFQRAAKGAEIVAHPGATNGPPDWTLSSIFRDFRGTLPSQDRLPEFRACGAYGDRATDPFANRPVNLRDLAGRVGRARVEQITEELFLPIGLFHQLRTVLYDAAGRVVLLAGYYRARRAPAFDVDDSARLHALQPALRRWATLARAIGFEPLGDGALASAISAMRVPAALLHRDRIVLANEAARDLVARSGVSMTTLGAQGKTIRLRRSGVDLDLALLPCHALEPSVVEASRTVPTYLAPIVAALREGLSDKDIADRRGMPLSTVRTYVQRVLAIFGVGTRRALMRI